MSTVSQILVVCTLESALLVCCTRAFRARPNGVSKDPPHPLCSCHIILSHLMVGHSVCSWTYSYYGMMDPYQVYHRQVVRRDTSPREQIAAAIRDHRPGFGRLDPASVVHHNISALSVCISEAS
jgi:hypothetical protein